MIITLYKFHQIKLKSHSIPFTFIKQKKKRKAEEQSAREHAEKGTASAFVLLFKIVTIEEPKRSYVYG